MLISLNWIREFVDIPASLNPADLALQFTVHTAEVDGIEHVSTDCAGLVAARIESIRAQSQDSEKLRSVVVNAGSRKYASVTTAPNLHVGDVVVYAPPGATVGARTISDADPSGRAAEGMIVAGQALGLTQVGANALFLPPATAPGSAIDAALFDDWIIEIDNKSITHRPDCWGHYGIAREVAVMLDLPLKAYDVEPAAALSNPALPAIPIEIDDAGKCPRYTGLMMRGLKSQPAPLWMQVRLAHCGMRPIDLIVDLTNYIMLELGQPMHAFDGAKVANIQVAVAKPGEKFTTLDGVERVLPPNTLMIQSNRRNVAIAGIMGGAETEVSEATQTVLLESANFDAPTIRRAATAMGHRTEASARFEKSLDPVHTALGIGRFVRLARAELPGLEIASTLSDCYPQPKAPQPISIDCDFAARFIGKPVSPEEMVRILRRLEFKCDRDGTHLNVTPPSFRATKDISIEADIIEEIARCIGYNNIEADLPRISARHFETSPDLVVEERTLNLLCTGGDFAEVHGYIWYDDDWLRTLACEPGECITLKNPAADNCARLRRSLAPGMLAMAERNRHHFDRFQLLEIGSVFTPGRDAVEASQERRLGLLVAQQGKKADAIAWERLTQALYGWARQVFERTPILRSAGSQGSASSQRLIGSQGTASPAQRQSGAATPSPLPWEDPDRTAEIVLADRVIGRTTMVPLTLTLRIDERLKAWSFAYAELSLASLGPLLQTHEKLPIVPRFPQVELDFSALVDASRPYAAVSAELAGFAHPLLRRLSFVGAYEGGAIPAGRRSLSFRAAIGRDDRTLTDEEIRGFQASFREVLTGMKLELRG